MKHAMDVFTNNQLVSGINNVLADAESLLSATADQGGEEMAHLRSKAFLHLGKHLRAPWRWIYAFRWFPGFLLDVGYRLVAALRYRMFGRVDSCELPSPENRARFLP